MYIHPNAFILSTGCFTTCPKIILEYSLDCLRTFPEIFNDIPRNVWRHFSECLGTFPGMFEDIPRNVLATFSGIWYFPHSPRSPHSFPRSCIPGFILSRFLIHPNINKTNRTKENGIFLKKVFCRGVDLFRNRAKYGHYSRSANIKDLLIYKYAKVPRFSIKYTLQPILLNIKRSIFINYSC